jgi:hypothetical protein
MKITSSRVRIAKTDKGVAGRVRVADCAPVAPARCDSKLSCPPYLQTNPTTVKAEKKCNIIFFSLVHAYDNNI